MEMLGIFGKSIADVKQADWCVKGPPAVVCIKISTSFPPSAFVLRNVDVSGDCLVRCEKIVPGISFMSIADYFVE